MQSKQIDKMEDQVSYEPNNNEVLIYLGQYKSCFLVPRNVADKAFEYLDDFDEEFLDEVKAFFEDINTTYKAMPVYFALHNALD